MGVTEVELSGAEIVVQALIDEGVEYVFGYPGGSVLHIYDAFFKQEKIKHILARHEQGATHAADGYARATGKCGVCLKMTALAVYRHEVLRLDQIEHQLELFAGRVARDVHVGRTLVLDVCARFGQTVDDAADRPLVARDRRG